MMKRLIAIVLGSSALLGVSATAALAHGTAVPYHVPAPTACSDIETYTQLPGMVQTAGPLDMRGYSSNWEQVAYSPDLQRWNGSAWVTVDGTRPFYWGWVNRYGMYAAVVGFVEFGVARTGYYRIKHYFYWKSTNATHLQYSPHCYVGSVFV